MDAKLYNELMGISLRIVSEPQNHPTDNLTVGSILVILAGAMVEGPEALTALGSSVAAFAEGRIAALQAQKKGGGDGGPGHPEEGYQLAPERERTRESAHG